MYQTIRVQAFRTRILAPRPRDNHQHCPALQQPLGSHFIRALPFSTLLTRGITKTPRHLVAGHRPTSMVTPGSPTTRLPLSIGCGCPRLLWFTTQIIHGMKTVLQHPSIPIQPSYRLLVTELQQVIIHQPSHPARSVPVTKNSWTVARHSNHSGGNLGRQIL